MRANQEGSVLENFVMEENLYKPLFGCRVRNSTTLEYISLIFKKTIWFRNRHWKSNAEPDINYVTHHLNLTIDISGLYDYSLYCRHPSMFRPYFPKLKKEASKTNDLKVFCTLHLTANKLYPENRNYLGKIYVLGGLEPPERSPWTFQR